MNVVGARCLTSLVSASSAYDYLELFGLDSLTDQDKSLALATGSLTYGVTNEKLTAAFASIANDGIYQKPIYYTKVLDRQGNILLENTPSKTRIIKSSTAALLTSAMEDVISSDSSYYYQYGITPTGTLCQVDNMTLAGKSGTTTSGSDLWFVGYSPYYTCGIWSGYDESKVLVSGTEYHKQIWQHIMARIHDEASITQILRLRMNWNLRRFAANRGCLRWMACAIAAQAILTSTRNILHRGLHRQVIADATMHFVSVRNLARVRRNIVRQIRLCSGFICILMIVIWRAVRQRIPIIWRRRICRVAIFIRRILAGRYCFSR